MLAIRVMMQLRLLEEIGPKSDAVKAAKFRNFGHAAARIRKDARASIKRAPKKSRRGSRRRKGRRIRRATHKPAPPGQPVYTQSGASRRAIVYDANEHGAIIGPRASVVGDAMAAHEHGGSYKGGQYPERPVMGPALAANVERFAGSWAGSIGPT